MYNQTVLIILFKLLVWFWVLPVTLEIILMSWEQYTQPVKHVFCSTHLVQCSKTRKTERLQILEKIRMPPGREMPTIKRCVPRHSDKQYNHRILRNTCIQLQRTLQKPYDILQTQQQTKRNEMELSKHIWSLKDVNKPFQIKWKIIKWWQPYSNNTKKCNLCLYGKYIIICRKDLCSLNKCDKLGSSCLHRKRYILKNFKNQVS